jgi:hypothetical protein
MTRTALQTTQTILLLSRCPATIQDRHEDKWGSNIPALSNWGGGGGADRQTQIKQGDPKSLHCFKIRKAGYKYKARR